MAFIAIKVKVFIAINGKEFFHQLVSGYIRKQYNSFYSYYRQTGALYIESSIEYIYIYIYIYKLIVLDNSNHMHALTFHCINNNMTISFQCVLFGSF